MFGTIYDSGGSGGNYSNNEDYTLTICSDNGDAVQVDFDDFITEDGYDYLYIYDGSTSGDPEIAALTGNLGGGAGTYTSSGTCITLRFRSDFSVTSGGFMASISCVEPAEQYTIDQPGDVTTCNATLYDSGGAGGNYGNNENYTKVFCSDNGQPLEIDFSQVSLRRWDHIYVYDGSGTSGTVLYHGTWTTTAPSLITSTSTCATFVFTSDGTQTRPGFAADITCVPGPNTISLTSAAGTDAQSVCPGTAITDITYATTGATGATFSGLPSGVSGSWSSNVVTISGTPATAATYNYTVTLTGGSDTGSATGTITVEDDTAPVPDLGSLTDVTAECTVTSLTAPTATDNCVGSVTGTHNATLPLTGEGTTVVTWTYDDGNGNTSTQNQNVIIDDVTAPSLRSATCRC